MGNSKTNELKPVVISSQRSGLNFLRVCIESLTGRRTPGKPLIVEVGSPVFVRTHDAANIAKKGDGAWKEIDEKVAEGRNIVLLIRDPFEIYARELKIADEVAARFKLELYVSNLNHFCSLKCYAKRHFYYEDFTVEPMSMAGLIQFMDIRLENGQSVKEETVAKEWNKMQETGRDMYDMNQKKAGGSMSRNAADKRSFHQSILSTQDKDMVIALLDGKASVAGKGILARYIPSFS